MFSTGAVPPVGRAGRVCDNIDPQTECFTSCDTQVRSVELWASSLEQVVMYNCNDLLEHSHLLLSVISRSVRSQVAGGRVSPVVWWSLKSPHECPCHVTRVSDGVNYPVTSTFWRLHQAAAQLQRNLQPHLRQTVEETVNRKRSNKTPAGESKV